MIMYQEMSLYLSKIKTCGDAFLSGRLDNLYEFSNSRYNMYGSRFSVWCTENEKSVLFTVCNDGTFSTSDKSLTIFDEHGEENNPLGKGSLRYIKGGTIPKTIDGTNENISTENIGEFNEELFFQYNLLYQDRALLAVCIASYFRDYPIDFFTINLNFIDDVYEEQKYIKSSKGVT